ncbi:cytochrome P450 [Streptomyces sp. NPDC007205]|uniref:cytochrome P450 n=1 Tax=Streptomyces sp. NPDC007205 TaxID=3154316 RepID=UPI00340F3456
MTRQETTPPRIPTARAHPLDPPPELSEMRGRCPVAPLTYADGHEGWIVTSHQLARQVLSDSRFSSNPRLRHSAVHDVLGDGQPPEEDVPGMFVGMDPPEHTKYRRLLTGELSTRRMREMEPKIAAVAHELIDRMQADGADTADLVSGFAMPLPSRVICDLLGIQYADWQDIQPVSEKMLRIDSSAEEVKDCYRIIFEFLANVVALKQKEPGDDLLSGLVQSAELSEVELASVAFQLFTAGHETTANMFSLGTYTLLTHPEQLAALRADAGLMNSAIEELLRYLTVIQFGISRGAAEDVELGGRTVRAGQTVTVSLPAANRDPERFTEPDRFDLTRVPSGNLAFGFGVHQCVAQQLARAELRIGFQVLLDRLPGLRLTVPADQVRMRDGAIVYGCQELPVAW